MVKESSALNSIVQAKAKLLEELQKLEEQEKVARTAEAASAHATIISLLEQFSEVFSVKQRDEIAAFVVTAKPKPRAAVAAKGGRGEVEPKYWLPHTQETWSGRGRPPRAFAAWQGTAAYNEWKARHPNEKFPAFPG